MLYIKLLIAYKYIHLFILICLFINFLEITKIKKPYFNSLKRRFFVQRFEF